MNKISRDVHVSDCTAQNWLSADPPRISANRHDRSDLKSKKIIGGEYRLMAIRHVANLSNLNHAFKHIIY